MNKLAKYIQGVSAEAFPIPSNYPDRLDSIKGIKAVVFDIYGTLFTSSSGDISLADQDDKDLALRKAFEESGCIFKKNIPLSERFYQKIREHHQKFKEENVDYPEVEIRVIFKDFLDELLADGVLECKEAVSIESLVVCFECLNNPVWPMPGLAQSLEELRRYFSLGIVSNAQFYTPLLFEAFLGKTPADLGFEPKFQVYSYQKLTGKPSTVLYKDLLTELAKEGIEAHEAVFIGNDIRNDIWPAQLLGMKTILFAGDERSLRLREDDDRCKEVVPDAVIHSLDQLKIILR